MTSMYSGTLNTEEKSNYNYDWNVIREDDFKKRVREVFKVVSSALTNTLGPYGSTTIIEQYGEMYPTKDGWQVLKNIHFKDQINNNILTLLLRISAQVVLKVGDGSTSSIVAANSILEQMADNEIIKKIRPKEFMTILNHCVNKISEMIYSNATKIDKTRYDEIYKLAYVATNGDDTVADMIQKIYLETNNPSIEYVKSNNDSTYYEIVDGYKIENLTYIDTIFTTNDAGACIVNKPYFLLFDHKLTLDSSVPIINAVLDKVYEEKRRLVVVAPYYDKFLLEHIQKQTVAEYKIRGTSNIVYCRMGLMNNMSHNLYNDFSIMCGAQIIKEQHLEEFESKTADEMKELVKEYIGETEQVIINAKDTVVKGFVARNENMYNKIVEDATTKYNAMELDYRNRGIVDTKLNELKNRVTKLAGSMGIIYVGGYSTLEKKANFDLIEDAIKACESAYLHGYNCGGNLVIPYTIIKIQNDASLNNMSDEEYEIYNLLFNAFTHVFYTVLKNKYNEDTPEVSTKITEIINGCISDTKLMSYNLITEEFSYDVINSCITDIEILKAASSIISLLISSNQYISILPQE